MQVRRERRSVSQPLKPSSLSVIRILALLIRNSEPRFLTDRQICQKTSAGQEGRSRGGSSKISRKRALIIVRISLVGTAKMIT